MRRRDPVTPELRDAVLARDRGCIASRVCDCIASTHCDGRLTLDHVKDQPRMGKRAPSDLEHLLTLCWHHHLDGWATAHRPELRAYLLRVGERGEAA
jgi:hypothetical protein